MCDNQYDAGETVPISAACICRLWKKDGRLGHNCEKL